MPDRKTRGKDNGHTVAATFPGELLRFGPAALELGRVAGAVAVMAEARRLSKVSN